MHYILNEALTYKIDHTFEISTYFAIVTPTMKFQLGLVAIFKQFALSFNFDQLWLAITSQWDILAHFWSNQWNGHVELYIFGIFSVMDHPCTLKSSLHIIHIQWNKKVFFGSCLFWWNTKDKTWAETPSHSGNTFPNGGRVDKIKLEGKPPPIRKILFLLEAG